MNKCIKFLFCVFILVSISGCTGDSSEGFFLGKKPEYEVKNETRNKTIILRATLKSGEVSNVGIESGRGIIKWMCDEGTEVRTGDDLVHISMENTEDRVRNRKYRLANRIDSMENLNAAGPSEIAEIDKALFEKMLLLEKSLFEEKWIRNPKTIDEILKIKNNAKIAEIDYEHAKKMYALKKIVAEKGFDSKFSLKSAEIDLRSKEIEFEYAKRSLMQLNEPPLAVISKAPRKLRGMENSRVKYYPVSVSVDVKGRVSVGSKATIKVFLGSKTGIFVPMDAVKKQENSYVITAGSYLGEKIEENNVEVFDRDWIIINPKPSLSEFVTPEIHSNAVILNQKNLRLLAENLFL